MQAGILDLLHELRRDIGTAILLITHDMGVVADLADDLAVMRHGQIVETGLANQVFSAPRADYTRALLDAVPRTDTETSPSGSIAAAASAAADRRRRRPRRQR